jgi:hypothetical protein
MAKQCTVCSRTSEYTNIDTFHNFDLCGGCQQDIFFFPTSIPRTAEELEIAVKILQDRDRQKALLTSKEF